MVRPLKRVETEAACAPAESLALRVADEGRAPGDNPVGRLQRELEIAMAGAGEPRWSARRTLAFMVLTNGVFWAALIWGVSKL